MFSCDNWKIHDVNFYCMTSKINRSITFLEIKKYLIIFSFKVYYFAFPFAKSEVEDSYYFFRSFSVNFEASLTLNDKLVGNT